MAGGCITEVYYPTIDEPQIRDLQFLVSDGKTFFHDERRNLQTSIEPLASSVPGFKVINSDPQGRYAIHKQVIGDPHQNCLLVNTRLKGEKDFVKNLQLYVLCAPHLEIAGWGNTGQVIEIAGRTILTAHKRNTWLVLGATVPFEKCSCGYVGVNDGWTDLASDYNMQWEYDCALDGNIALTGKLVWTGEAEFTLGMAFGRSLHDAANTLFQSLGTPFERARQTFLTQWERPRKRITSFPPALVEHSPLLETSVNLLLAHEDKEFSGAMIASSSIPWGEEKGDEELGGYHLVWTRDLVQCASALLAVDDLSTALRALIYLAVSQREDGGFYQNFWIDGRPYWQGVQLDEVSFPIMLAWRLQQRDALRDFDPYSMVSRAAAYVIREGPSTPQERWEECPGLSPSTLAANIAGLICAAEFMRERGDAPTAKFVAEYADFLEAHIEPWTVTTQGTLLPGIRRHYIRVTPPWGSDGRLANEDPNHGILRIPNIPYWEQSQFPAKEIVDAGFLELVRYGIRKAGDPLIEDSLKVIDAVLKVETPAGPCWRRYNHDAYGQRNDGSSYGGWGTGRAWPLLTGERGHYELAAGRPAEPFLRAMEGFTHGVGLLPEQIWDEADIPEQRMYLGKATGSAIPLMWAHAEYVKLLKSVVDRKVFELIAPVAQRYAQGNTKRKAMEIWKFNRQPTAVKPGTLLRILGGAPFQLRWTSNNWATQMDTGSISTSIGIDYVDIPVAPGQKDAIQFTFFWTSAGNWEGKDYAVEILERT
jgi:glucoamylase